MIDIVNSEIRSKMMAGIRGKDTQIEMQIRKDLHALGYRYRLHDPKLPGKPDLTLLKFRAVIFVNGCFWHGHDCQLFKWPATNKSFWKKKIRDTKKRDKEKANSLLLAGWRVLTIWECSLRGSGRLPSSLVIERIVSWLHSEQAQDEIRGLPVGRG